MRLNKTNNWKFRRFFFIEYSQILHVLSLIFYITKIFFFQNMDPQNLSHKIFFTTKRPWKMTLKIVPSSRRCLMVGPPLWRVQNLFLQFFKTPIGSIAWAHEIHFSLDRTFHRGSHVPQRFPAHLPLSLAMVSVGLADLIWQILLHALSNKLIHRGWLIVPTLIPDF